MSSRHPIISVVGSSGSGTTVAKNAFEQIFNSLGINAALVQGDSFHRFTRDEMEAVGHGADCDQSMPNHFSPDANHLNLLEDLFREYSECGAGHYRRYIHNTKESERHAQDIGTFTPWRRLPENSDLLFYEGLHGAVVTSDINIAQYPDLIIGITPTINLEWLQKVKRDTKSRGYSIEAVRNHINQRMADYTETILPQFSRTHINMQRIPLVDIANPFSGERNPSMDETLVVAHFRQPGLADFPRYLQMIPGTFMSKPSTMVIPGGKLALAVELMLTPIIKKLMQQRITKALQNERVLTT